MSIIGEIYMTLKLLLELIAIIPALNTDAQQVLTELRSSDDGEAKLLAILESAKTLVTQIETAIGK